MSSEELATAPISMPSTIKVSIGTAGLLGLADVRQSVLPTTAYLMLGEGCVRDCAFCAQARHSHAHANALSRIIWPPFDSQATIQRIVACYAAGTLQRACLQVTTFAGHLEQAIQVTREIRRHSAIPLSISIAVPNLDAVTRLFRAGADRLGLALDAATPALYRETKGGAWSHAIQLLEQAAQAFPGRISTHLIVGLGETERELVERFQWCADRGITIGLFAFTPVAGTRLSEQAQPSLPSYRRLQAARYLIAQGWLRVEPMCFDEAGQISSYGLPWEQLAAYLANGAAFQTAGCLGCNRPYYNERPGGTIYNYPGPLDHVELAKALQALPRA